MYNITVTLKTLNPLRLVHMSDAYGEQNNALKNTCDLAERKCKSKESRNVDFCTPGLRLHLHLLHWCERQVQEQAYLPPRKKTHCICVLFFLNYICVWRVNVNCACTCAALRCKERPYLLHLFWFYNYINMWYRICRSRIGLQSHLRKRLRKCTITNTR